MSNIRDSIVSAVFSAIILAALVGFWQFATKGGVIALLGGVPSATLDERFIDAMGAMQIDFGQPIERNVDTIYPPDKAGIVTATLDTESSNQGAICGYTAASEEALNAANRSRGGTMQGTASIEYRNNTYIPLASMSMPVGTRQYWIVAPCSGTAVTETSTTVYFRELIAFVEPGSSGDRGVAASER